MDELRHPLCFLRLIWWNLRHGIWAGMVLSGHSYEEMPSPPMQQILRCKTCGHESVGHY